MSLVRQNSRLQSVHLAFVNTGRSRICFRKTRGNAGVTPTVGWPGCYRFSPQRLFVRKSVALRLRARGTVTSKGTKAALLPSEPEPRGVGEGTGGVLVEEAEEIGAHDRR